MTISNPLFTTQLRIPLCRKSPCNLCRKFMLLWSIFFNILLAWEPLRCYCITLGAEHLKHGPSKETIARCEKRNIPMNSSHYGETEYNMLRHWPPISQNFIFSSHTLYLLKKRQACFVARSSAFLLIDQEKHDLRLQRSPCGCT